MCISRNEQSSTIAAVFTAIPNFHTCHFMPPRELLAIRIWLLRGYYFYGRGKDLGPV